MNNFPSFYAPERIGTLFYPDAAEIADAAVATDFWPAAHDEVKVHLIIVDMQIDFCHPNGSLYVPGASEDIRRLIEFIFREAEHITSISCTLDSHVPFQIFHPPWWTNADGEHPAPLTMITREDVENGTWRPLVMPEYSREYVRRLEEQSKKTLTIWPYHVLLGSIGGILDPELWSAVMWHSIARKAQPTWLIKGRIPQSEHYSAIQPEIPVPDHPLGGKNTTLLNAVEDSDYVLMAGEAESHCVLETLEDLVDAYRGRPDLLRRIYVLQDCTSSVAHPDVDFHAMAQERFATFAALGVNFINSTDEMPWERKGTAVPSLNNDDPAPVAGLQRGL